MAKKWLVAIQVLIILASLAGSVYVAFTPNESLMRWYDIDDAFYYYKVAQNILAGHGSSFDGINLSNGYHPLWMVVCISVFWLSKFDLMLPLRVLVIVSSLFNAATALFLFRFLVKHIHLAAAAIGALFWALFPQIFKTVTERGMESSISVFFLIFLLYKASNLLNTDRQWSFWEMAEVGLIGVFTILSRLDNVFIVAVIGLFLVFKIKRISRELIFDLAVISFAVISSWVLKLGLVDIRVNSYSVYPMLGSAILVKPIIYYFCGLYEGFGQRSSLGKITRQILAAFISAILMYLVLAGMHRLGILQMFSRSVLLYEELISAALVFCLRLLIWKHTELKVNPFQKFLEWFKATWKRILLDSTAYALPIALIMGIYVTVNKLIFHTFSPVSGQIKVWWSTLPNTVYFQPNSLLSLLGIGTEGNKNPWSFLTSRIDDVAGMLVKLVGSDSSTFHTLVFLCLLLIFVFIVMAIFNSEQKRVGRLAVKMMLPAIFLGCIFSVAYYNTVGYQAIRGWYWINEMMTIVILCAVLLDPFFVWVDHFRWKPLWSIVISSLTVVVIVSNHVTFISNTFPMKINSNQEITYMTDIKELERLTEPGSKIGMTGGGLTAYFIQDRTIVNLDGLINSAEYFNAMKNGKAQAFLDALPLDYVYGKSYMVESSDPYKEILGGRLIKIGVIHSFDNFTLYEYDLSQ